MKEHIELLQKRLEEKVIELQNAYDKLPIPTAEHINNFNKLYDELIQLTTKQTLHCNKASIAQLSKLHAEEINQLNLEEAGSCLELFNYMNEVMTKIWGLYKLSDINATDERALQIMTNLATSDADLDALKKLKELEKSNSFFKGKNSLVNEDALPQRDNMKSWAILYLDYRSNKTQLECNQSIVSDRVLELLSENANSSTCLMS